MKRPATRQAPREPIDRRQLRLIHALLAFPVAGVIGFTGNLVVKRITVESPAVVAPAPPERSTDEKGSPRDRDDRPPAEDNSGAGVA